MKRILIPALSLILLTVFCFSCSTESPSSSSPHLYGDFFVRYLAQPKQIKATASFLEGDTIRTARPLEIEGGVNFQDKRMDMRYLPGGTVRYGIEEPAAYSDKFTFSFAKSQVFEMGMQPIERFNVKEGKCQLADGLSLFVDFPPEENESLVLFFSDAKRKASTLTLEGPIPNQQITIPAAQLSQLKPGAYELYLVKKKKINQEGKLVSSIGAIEYYTPAIAFQAY